jgi:arylsulfatase A-like enzyme
MPEPPPSRWATVRRHAELAGVTALCAGAVDGMLAARELGLPMVQGGAGLGAGVLVPVGMVLGAAQGLVVLAGAWALRRTVLATRWRAATSTSGDRQPVVGFHAWVLAAVLAATLERALWPVFARELARIKDPELAESFERTGVVGASIAFFVLTVALVPATRVAMAALDRRVGLPLPRSRLGRVVLYVAAPALLAIVPLFWRYGEQLGVLAVPLGLVLFLVAEGLLLALYDALPERVRRGRIERIAAWSLRAVLLAATLFAAVLMQRWPGAATVAAEGRAMPMAVEALRSATDVDRDGISSLYGGNDCAPFDGKRLPSAREVPRNGVDENCDGKDGESLTVLERPPPYHGEVRDQGKRLNVLLLVVDSLRPDHLRLYGYRHETSPHIDEIGKDAWVFRNAYAQSSTTRISMPSLLGGRSPGTMQWRSGPDPDPAELMLPALLKRHGYQTTLVLNQYMRRATPGLQRPFDNVAVTPKGVDWRSGDHAIALAIGAIDRAHAQGRPFFVTMHFDDVHHPYKAHEGRAVPTFSSSDANVQSYDRCIAAFDNILRVLTAHLKNQNLWDETIFILTSDHGEEFEEHGGTIHSATCYAESVRVPLVVRVPGQAAADVEPRVALIDVVPTLVEALDLPRGEVNVDGQSLFVPVLAPERVDAERPMFCSVFQLLKGRKNFFIRSVRDGRFTLVHELLSDRRELYDTARDPGEKRDIAASDPETVARLGALLEAELEGNLWDVRKFK